MSSLALTSGWYYIYTSYCTPDSGSGYKGRPLVEEFKKGMNGGIRRKLMEAENLPASIEQWYRRATALDRN